MLLVAFSKRRTEVLLCVLVLGSVYALSSEAQTRLSLEQAVSKALESRASLKAEAERIAVARGLKRQAGGDG